MTALQFPVYVAAGFACVAVPAALYLLMAEKERRRKERGR